jgi:hypothetical protein
MADMSILAVPWLVEAPFRFSGLIAGEDLDPGSACYIAADGKVWMTVSDANGTAPDTPGAFDGMCVRGADEGEYVTLMGLGAIIELADEVLVIGDPYFPSDTAGALSPTAICAGELPIVKAVSAVAVRVVAISNRS